MKYQTTEAIEQLKAGVIRAQQKPSPEKWVLYIPAPRVGRNQPCPCKSGKKFKKCCGKNR